MSDLPSITQDIEPAPPVLWAVKSYLDLISRDDALVYGPGLKRLYTMSSGLATYNDEDIDAATAKAEKMGLIPFSLHSFMMTSILKNCFLYGGVLSDLINERIVSIANGDVQNPEPTVKYSPIAARRHFYVPPATFIKRALKAINEDTGYHTNWGGHPNVTTVQDVANEADFILTQMTGNEGHIFPGESSFGALAKVVSGLLGILEMESTYPSDSLDYRRRSRGALKILWFIAKLLLGDLSVRPERKDINLVDLERKIHMADGTLAAIPFPIPQSIALFNEYGSSSGVSMKGRFYLAAVSAAAFDRRSLNSEG